MAIVRHINTNKLYRYNGDNNYINLHSGNSGEIPPEQAQKIFKINAELTFLCHEYPMIEEMITKLKLVCDKPLL